MIACVCDMFVQFFVSVAVGILCIVDRVKYDFDTQFRLSIFGAAIFPLPR